MKATPFEFRHRFLIHAIIYVLGFTVPWNYWLHLDSAGPNAHVWGTLAAKLSALNPATINILTAFNNLLIFGILFVLAGAILRTWGAAYLGSEVVKDSSLHGQTIVAAGPYRHLRNPLYLGTFLHTFALALLMPPSGAIFSIIAIGLLQLRLIGAEQSFLTEKLGEPYRAYCDKIPSLIPAITPRVPASPQKPRWPNAFLGEVYMWGVAVSFAVLGWRYNAILITKGVLISLGISIIIRAFLPKPQS
ncbi:MAG TPA: isoprenylcysteine carboxylmethyltransferase family protein [Edaphobacter sp.]|jgi:protein-S-isoprenylcysteine O-methyltransferase Ste14|nr:isoprenylcysteine carboxylmethyltransferase family protein [Edaphobacter sp.]